VQESEETFWCYGDNVRIIAVSSVKFTWRYFINECNRSKSRISVCNITGD